MAGFLKRTFKRNSHNWLFKQLAGTGRSFNRIYENRNHDIYSNGELTVLKKIGKLQPQIVVDGGANVGAYSSLLIQYTRPVILFAFEPVAETYHKLEKNIPKRDGVFLVHKGLYKENTEKEINLFESDTHSSIYSIEGFRNERNRSTIIQLVSGDTFYADKGISQIDFLKLDVEGAEYDVLLGFQRMISAGSIRAIQFEYGYINITTKKLLIDFYHFFEEHGYIVGKIFPKKVEFRPYKFKYEDFIGPNFIAVKKSDNELIALLTKK